MHRPQRRAGLGGRPVRARRQRAVVCTTPSALKSFVLRFVEIAHSLDQIAVDAATDDAEEEIVHVLHSILRLGTDAAETKARKDEKSAVMRRLVEPLSPQIYLTTSLAHDFGDALRNARLLHTYHFVLYPWGYGAVLLSYPVS